MYMQNDGVPSNFIPSGETATQQSKGGYWRGERREERTEEKGKGEEEGEEDGGGEERSSSYSSLS